MSELDELDEIPFDRVSFAPEKSFEKKVAMIADVPKREPKFGWSDFCGGLLWGVILVIFLIVVLLSVIDQLMNIV